MAWYNGTRTQYTCAKCGEHIYEHIYSDEIYHFECSGCGAKYSDSEVNANVDGVVSRAKFDISGLWEMFKIFLIIVFAGPIVEGLGSTAFPFMALAPLSIYSMFTSSTALCVLGAIIAVAALVLAILIYPRRIFTSISKVYFVDVFAIVAALLWQAIDAIGNPGGSGFWYFLFKGAPQFLGRCIFTYLFIKCMTLSLLTILGIPVLFTKQRRYTLYMAVQWLSIVALAFWFSAIYASFFPGEYYSFIRLYDSARMYYHLAPAVQNLFYTLLDFMWDVPWLARIPVGLAGVAGLFFAKRILK